MTQNLQDIMRGPTCVPALYGLYRFIPVLITTTPKRVSVDTLTTSQYRYVDGLIPAHLSGTGEPTFGVKPQIVAGQLSFSPNPSAHPVGH